MARRVAWLLIAVIVLIITLPRAARADQPGAHTVPVAVLAFDSEDSEEQADALTGALRSRIRAAQGWSLIETTQALGMLTAALKCPSRPPPECQQKIAEQIKAERYIWGFVAKGPTQGQVTAEIHLYQKGKADTVLKESYADNLKDSNDDTLRKIAARIVERLGGTAVGVVVVKTTEPGATEVVVDGEKRVPLQNGTARVELAAGGHAIEIASSSGSPLKRNVVVTAGRETVVELTAASAVESPSSGGGGGPPKKVIGGVVMGTGAILGAVAIWQLVSYLGYQSDGEALKGQVQRPDTLVPPLPADTQCRDTSDERCRTLDSDSKRASALAIGLGAASAVALGVGAYLFFSDSSSQTEQAAKSKTRVVPTGGPNSAGLVVVGAF
ncbi:MAG: hypothetical protein KF819_24115 [Labilithrix sp.]|nr:hypothetical protein [Labilithrix sp.]